MPSVLREHQHELSDADGENGVVFGTEDTGYLTLTLPAYEQGDIRAGDRDRPMEDGRDFGRDFRGAKSIVFEIGVLTDHLSTPANRFRTNLDYLDALEGLWTDEKWRESREAFAMLRSRQGGQTWRAYGRPRRYEESAVTLTERGYTPIVADFAMIDSSVYSDSEYNVDVRLALSTGNGLKAPLVAPLSTVQSSAGSGVVLVGGSRATWPVIEFHGPVTNPRVQVGNLFSCGLNATLMGEDVYVFDPRPWVRAVYRQSDGAGFPGIVSPDTPMMKRTLLKPGEHAVSYTGVDNAGSSFVRIRWRNARSRT